MENLCKKLMLGGSMAAMLAAITASATAQEQQTESVEVSASRIQIQGYEASTPVTVVGAEQLNRDAKVDIGDAIRELPAVGGHGDSPSNGSHSGNASQGDAGIDTIDLRGLGVVRTLVLFDGQRIVTSNPNSGGPPAIGGVDLSTIPSSVVERVDVVTGGASAAWGSDAVAGVVNLVINKTFTGFKANATYGNDSHNDHQEYKFEVTAGTDFFGGRGHTEFAGDYTMSPDAMYNWNRPWFDKDNRALYPCSVVDNGSATALCHTPSGVYSNSFTNGGLITANAAGPNGIANRWCSQCCRLGAINVDPRGSRPSIRGTSRRERPPPAMRSRACSSWAPTRNRCHSILASIISRPAPIRSAATAMPVRAVPTAMWPTIRRPRCRITITICSATPATI